MYVLHSVSRRNCNICCRWYVV